MAVDCNNTLLQVTSPPNGIHDLTALTFSVWTHIDTLPGGVLAGFIISLQTSLGQYRKLLALYGTNVLMYIEYSTTDAQAQAAGLPLVGSWHHLCARWDDSVNSGKPDVFIDGTDGTASRVTPAGNLQSDGGFLRLGAMSPVPLSPFDGKLADPAVFDRRLTDQEIGDLARGRLRALHLNPTWHITLENSTGPAAIGQIGLRDTTGPGGHIDSITSAPNYYRDPPLHWPDEPVAVPFAGRATRNSRPTMNVVPGTKLATMRRVV